MKVFKNTSLITILLILNVVNFAPAYAQVRTKISETGWSVAFYEKPERIEHSERADGSTVYLVEIKNDTVTQGMLVIELATYHPDEDDQFRILTTTINSIRGLYQEEDGFSTAVKATAVIKTSKPHARLPMIGIHERWGVKDGNSIDVDAWVNKAYVVVLYSYGEKANNFAKAFFSSLKYESELYQATLGDEDSQGKRHENEEDVLSDDVNEKESAREKTDKYNNRKAVPQGNESKSINADQQSKFRDKWGQRNGKKNKL